MTDEERDAGPDRQDGVFGNLPRSRPGTRSPRRDRGSKASGGEAAAGAAKSPRGKPQSGVAQPRATSSSTAAKRRSQAAASAKPRALRPPPPRADAAAAPATPTAPSSQRGIEDVAWAGVAAAAEAATLGVRLASRAIEAMRGAVERR